MSRSPHRSSTPQRDLVLRSDREGVSLVGMVEDRCGSFRQIGNDKRYDSIWSDPAEKGRGSASSWPPVHFG